VQDGAQFRSIIEGLADPERPSGQGKREIAKRIDQSSRWGFPTTQS
jgi:hypothetical protein